MSHCFDRATSFNQPLATWDVSNVCDIAGLIKDAVAFNQPLDTWDVRQVVTMAHVFNHAVAFNKSLVSRAGDHDARHVPRRLVVQSTVGDLGRPSSDRFVVVFPRSVDV